MEYYLLNCGSIKVYYSFLYSDTKTFFSEYIIGPFTEANGLMINISNEYMDENRWLIAENEQSKPFLEYKCLMLATGNALLEFKHAIFHAVAVLWNGFAWLITAPTGTGKTTQLRHWKRILRKDVVIINGDKPILEIDEDGIIWVYSSPWRGKEHVGIPGIKARLGGIILLQQGESNHISRITDKEAVIPLFAEFISYPENTEQIRKQAEFLEQILNFIPVWKLVNLGNIESATLTINTIQEYMEAENG